MYKEVIQKIKSEIVKHDLNKKEEIKKESEPVNKTVNIDKEKLPKKIKKIDDDSRDGVIVLL